ncbi:MAG: magnesium/cobalt transporter CorA [Thermodesulfobacteriota bacterium]
MLKLFTKTIRKVGLSPGTLIQIPETKTEKVKITIIDYDATQLQEKEAATITECFPFKNKPTVTWINIDNIHQVEVMEKIGAHFGIHQLTLEDIMNTGQRPKMEDFEDYIFMVVKMIYYDENDNEIKTEQISLLIGPTFVISFQEKEGDVFNPIRDRIRKAQGRIRKMKADYLAYALIDTIVDHYFVVLEKLGEKIEDIEEALITNPTPETLQNIHTLKRELIFMRKSIWPLREVVNKMERGESSLIDKSIEVYLRDIYDHTIQVVDTIETFRDMVSGMLDIYLSSISNKMNEVMKVLTIIATIFIPLTFIAGIYGMNFKYMPELEWYWGYAVALILMGLIAFAMVLYFRNKKWL